MQQTTIFDGQFEQVRRRQLMPVLLKVYCLLFIVVSVLLVLVAALDLNWRIYKDYSFLIGAAIIALVFTSMAASLWFEWKWAIWYNLVLGGIYFLNALAACIFWGTVDLLFWGAMLTFPYWVLLLKIRHPWQYTAVTKL